MIYFIEHPHGYVKIGFSDNINDRISQIQVSSPYKLKLVLLIEGDFIKEAEFHTMFSSLSVSGEWFKFDKPIRDMISSLRDKDLSWQFGFGVRENSLGKLRKARIESGLTLKEVGDKLKVTKQSTNEMEQREINGTISINTMKRFCEALGYEFDYRIFKKI